jgi:hypothetical protein
VTADPHTPMKPAHEGSLGSAAPSADGSGGPATALEPAPKSPEPGLAPGAWIWVYRVRMFLLVVLCAGMGVLLVVLPWSLQWTDNHLLWGHPGLRTFLAHGFVRGVCSGLGFLDLWIGFREAVHYQESPGVVK